MAEILTGDSSAAVYDVLVRDFPNIFEHAYPECGDGWYELLNELCEKLIEADPGCSATQVKEKYGTLRFYAYVSDEGQDIIDEYEKKSGHVCEECGSTEDVSQSDGWVMTRCASCWGKRKDGMGKKKDRCMKNG